MAPLQLGRIATNAPSVASTRLAYISALFDSQPLVLLTDSCATYIVPTLISLHPPPQYAAILASFKMSAEEDQQSQSGYDEQAGGPGAPTPLAALEVGLRPETPTRMRLTTL